MDIFCKIINKKLPADIVHEDDKVVAFKDIKPKAETHILVAPKKHIASVAELQAGDKELVGELILAAQKVANAQNLKGYKILINVGKEGGQTVEHLHLHLLAGEIKELP